MWEDADLKSKPLMPELSVARTNFKSILRIVNRIG